MRLSLDAAGRTLSRHTGHCSAPQAAQTLPALAAVDVLRPPPLPCCPALPRPAPPCPASATHAGRWRCCCTATRLMAACQTRSRLSGPTSRRCQPGCRRCRARGRRCCRRCGRRPRTQARLSAGAQASRQHMCACMRVSCTAPPSLHAATPLLFTHTCKCTSVPPWSLSFPLCRLTCLGASASMHACMRAY